MEGAAREHAAMVEQEVRDQPGDGDGEHESMLELRHPRFWPECAVAQRGHGGGAQVGDDGDVAQVGEIAEERAVEMPVAQARGVQQRRDADKRQSEFVDDGCRS